MVVLIFWFLLFSLSNLLIKNKLAYHLTIDHYLSFSYPVKYKIDDIFVNENLRDNIIQTNFSFKRAIIENYKNFESGDHKFSFKYPASFTLSQKDFGGSDILYHIDFHSQQNQSQGFIQVWHQPYALADFLARSKATSVQDFLSFKQTPLKVHELPGYLWDYTVQSGANTYKGMEVFLKKDDSMYRVSYFTPANLWNKEQSDIFWSMVNSLKTR